MPTSAFHHPGLRVSDIDAAATWAPRATRIAFDRRRDQPVSVPVVAVPMMVVGVQRGRRCSPCDTAEPSLLKICSGFLT